MKREDTLLFPISLIFILLLSSVREAAGLCGSYSTDCQCITQTQVKPDFCFKIEENSPKGTCLGDFIDVSEDTNHPNHDGFQQYLNSNRTLNFELAENSICSSPNANVPTVTDWFNVTNTSLGTFTTNTEIDYEYYQGICGKFCLQINVRLQYANEGDGGIFTFFAFVDIGNVNDNPPVFQYTENTNLTVFEESINEETSNQMICFSELIATDADNVQETISYSVVTFPIKFSVSPDNNANQLCVTNLVSFDREAINNVSFVIKAEDEGNLTSSITVLFNIKDTNDNQPEFIHPNLTPEVYENATIDTFIAEYHAEDKDSGFNAELTYSIIDGSNKFAINSSTGELFVNGTLDAEMEDSITLTVRVQDGPGEVDEQSITVAILNVNDNPPVIVNSFKHYFTIPEGEIIHSTIVLILVKDLDEGQTQLTGHIVSGSEYVSGNLQVFPGTETYSYTIAYKVDELDYESIQEILVNFTITDGGSPELSVSSFLLINITDINDNPPYLSQTSFTVSEDSSPGLVIVSLGDYFRDNDSDANNNNKLDRFIEFENSYVSVESSGIVRKRIIDRETIPGGQIMFNVTFFDQGEPEQLNSTETIVLTVIDVNDNSPEFIRSEGYWFEVDENYPVIDFGEVNATDRDVGLNGKVIYTIIDSDLFTIDNVTGKLSLNTPLDREMRDIYMFTVMAIDLGNLSRNATINVTVIVRDQNDNDPVFDEDMTRTFTIPSDSKVNTKIAQLNATDKDIGENANISFTLNNSRIFSINSEGILRNKILLEEVANMDHKLLVTVFNDKDPERNSTTVISIYINSTSVPVPTSESNSIDSLTLYYIGGAVLLVLLAAITVVLCCLCCLCCHRRRSKSRNLPPLPPQSMTPKKGVLKVSSFKEEDDAGYEGSVNGDIPRSPTVNFSNNYQVRYFSQDQSMKAPPVKTETVRLEEKLSTDFVESPQIPTKDDTNQPQEVAEEVSSPPLSEDLSSNSSLSNSVYHSTSNQYYEHQPKNQHLPLREDTLKIHNEAISSGLIYQQHPVVHDSRMYGPPPPQEPPYSTGNGHYTAHGGKDLLPPNIQHYLSSNHHSNQSISAPVSHYVSQNGTPPSTDSSPRIQFIPPPDHSHGNHHNHRRLPHDKTTTPSVYYSNHHHGGPPISPHGSNHYTVDPPPGAYYEDPPGPPQMQNGGPLQHYTSSSTSSSNHRPDVSPPSPPQSSHYPPPPPSSLAALHHQPPPSSTRHGRHSHDRPPIMDGHLSPLDEYPPHHHSYIPPNHHPTTHSRTHVTYQHVLQHSRLYNNHMSRQSLEDTSTVASSLLDNYLQFDTHPPKHDDYLLSDAISVDDR